MTGLSLYTRSARDASAAVIQAYSTSFSLATRLLPRVIADDIRSVYALVRVADEIVDGPGAEAGLDAQTCQRELDHLEQQVAAAIESGFSANLVVHAFAETATRVGIPEAFITPFFDSMRRDLSPVHFTNEQELRTYVHGSAEVVGLMCARCFTFGVPLSEADAARIDEGARALGSAFQLVNFLRDIGADGDKLGRSYLPGIDPHAPDQHAVNEVLDTIDAELALAKASIPALPRSVRPAVLTAHDLFANLAERIRRVPAQELPKRRISVPSVRKAALAVGAARGLRG